MVATSMSCFGQHGMFYLCAAVSDFYVPWESMVSLSLHPMSLVNGRVCCSINEFLVNGLVATQIDLPFLISFLSSNSNKTEYFTLTVV